MQTKLVIISDIHGCYYTLEKLLRVCRKRQVVFNGDLIDRGLHSAKVVEYAIEQKIPTVQGNHEDLMLFGLCHSNRCNYTDDDLWAMNGGHSTMASYRGNVPQAHIDWIAGLPLYFEHDGLLISHTGFGKSRIVREALWRREAPDNDGVYRVIGHTPAKSPQFFPHYAMIDTGAAYASRGFGHMTAFLWPEKNYITIPTDKRDVA